MSALAFQDPAQDVETARSLRTQFGQLAAGVLSATFASLAPAAVQPPAPAAQVYRLPTNTMGTSREYKRSMAITCENSAFSPRSNIMQEPAVQLFIERVPSASERAVQRIHDLAMERFGHWPTLDTVFSLEEEEDGAALFVSLDTHGMDFDEQMRLELAMNADIHRDPELALTRRRIVLTVV